MLRKISIICLVLMFSILPVLTLSSCGLDSGAKLTVTISGNVSREATAEEFLGKCTYTFVPGSEEYFIVRSKTEAEKYGAENVDWIKDSEWTYRVKYKTFTNATYDDVKKTGVNVSITGYGFNGKFDNDTAIVSMYGERCTVVFNWERKPGH